MTAAGRTTTSKLQKGDRIVVEPTTEVNRWRSTTRKLTGKSDVVAGTVTDIHVHSIRYGSGRSTTYRDLTLDFGGGQTGKVLNAPPSQTFGVAPPLEPKLIHEETGLELVPGDEVTTFRGEKRILSGRFPREGQNGKITLEGDRTRYYPTVIGARFKLA